MAIAGHSVNQESLSSHDLVLGKLAARADRFVFVDSSTAINKIGQFANSITTCLRTSVANCAVNRVGVLDVEWSLRHQSLLANMLHGVMRSVRQPRSEAIHELAGDCREDFDQPKLIHKLAIMLKVALQGCLDLSRLWLDRGKVDAVPNFKWINIDPFTIVTWCHDHLERHADRALYVR